MKLNFYGERCDRRLGCVNMDFFGRRASFIRLNFYVRGWLCGL